MLCRYVLKCTLFRFGVLIKLYKCLNHLKRYIYIYFSQDYGKFLISHYDFRFLLKKLFHIYTPIKLNFM